MKKYYLQIMTTLLIWSVSVLTFADGIIPISYDDETQSGTDFANTFMKIIKNDLAPILEYGGAIILIFYAIVGLWKGFRESQEKHDNEAFKAAIVRAVILVVCGGALIYILKQIVDNIQVN